MTPPELPLLIDLPAAAAQLPLAGFVALEKTLAAIKDEEIARMVALAAKSGGQLTSGQRRACLERFADRIAAARTSVYRRSLAAAPFAASRPAPSAPTGPTGGDAASI
jgi:hypothetical protein